MKDHCKKECNFPCDDKGLVVLSSLIKRCKLSIAELTKIFTAIVSKLQKLAQTFPAEICSS